MNMWKLSEAVDKAMHEAIELSLYWSAYEAADVALSKTSERTIYWTVHDETKKVMYENTADVRVDQDYAVD